jgi:hypothetical protein
MEFSELSLPPRAKRRNEISREEAEHRREEQKKRKKTRDGESGSGDL